MKGAGKSLNSDFPPRGNAYTKLHDHLQKMLGNDSINQWKEDGLEDIFPFKYLILDFSSEPTKMKTGLCE